MNVEFTKTGEVYRGEFTVTSDFKETGIQRNTESAPDELARVKKEDEERLSATSVAGGNNNI